MWRKGHDILKNMNESMGENILSAGGETLDHAKLTKNDFPDALRDDKYTEKPHEIKIKKEVPGPIGRESNVSGDYLNEISHFEFLLEHVFDDVKDGGYDLDNETEKKSFEEALITITNKFDKNTPRHMRTYLERFPPSEYVNVITGENKDIINMIDARVDHLYDLLGKTWTPELVQAHRADWEEALHVANEITSIVIYGVPSFKRKAA